jgi:IS30 family transposase
MKVFISISGRTKNKAVSYTNILLASKEAEKSVKTAYRGQIANKVSIELRPKAANNRMRFGDFEQDTIIGANHKGAILTLVDRKTLFTKLVLLESKNAMQLSQQTIKTLKKYKPYLHTITSDNGKEFAMHQAIAKELDIQYYFTHPYSSYECGTVENTNGLIRRYIPKKSSFEHLTQEKLDDCRTTFLCHISQHRY